jgi:hypothetical protein
MMEFLLLRNFLGNKRNIKKDMQALIKYMPCVSYWIGGEEVVNIKF